MKKRKIDIGALIAEELQMPKTAICNTFTVEFCGNDNVTVTGCKGVAEYSETALILNLGDITVKFSGENLQIASFGEQQALVTGNVLSMEFVT